MTLMLPRASTLPARYCIERSRSYDTGRFSAKRENGVYHFQNLVREFLQEDA